MKKLLGQVKADPTLATVIAVSAEGSLALRVPRSDLKAARSLRQRLVHVKLREKNGALWRILPDQSPRAVHSATAGA
jgi:hypothetical protein